MSNKNLKIKTLSFAAATLLAMWGIGFSAEKPDKTPPVEPPYSREEALKTAINPHEQINDVGEVLWENCLICHRNVPDIKKEKSIDDVLLRFEGDINDLCYDCHPVAKHPGREDIGAAMSGMEAPDHLVVPSKIVQMNRRLAMKDVPTLIPLEPKTGKVLCVSCHNPHERGVLSGRADWGADSFMRLRSEGLDICQYCHRK